MVTRTAATERHIDEEIGPRQVGTRYRCHYWGDESTVLNVDRNPSGDRAWMTWSITEATDEEAARNTSRTHCTAWDPRDLVVSQPRGA